MFTIEDKEIVKDESASTENTKWPAPVNMGGRGKVSRPVKDSVLVKKTWAAIPDMIPVLNLGCKAVDSSTTTVCRLGNLSRGEDSHFHHIQKSNNGTYAHINQNIRKLHCKQRPEDPGSILSINHRASRLSLSPLRLPDSLQLMGSCGADIGIRGVKVLQPGMGTTPAVIGGHGGSEPGARALILRSK